MGVVTVSTSASRSPFGLGSSFSTCASATKRVKVLAFKTVKTKNRALVSSKESVTSAVETSKENPKRLRRIKKPLERVQALSTAEGPSCLLDLDYNEAAAKLNRIYKLSPTTTVFDTEDADPHVKVGGRRRKEVADIDESESRTAVPVRRSQRKKSERLSLQKRIDLKNKKEFTDFASIKKRKHGKDNEKEKIKRLVMDYSASSNLGSIDWKRMKFPPVLSASEHTWLFRLIQPMKAILPVKGELHNTLGREPTDHELAEATNMSVTELRKHIQVGLAARSKLIKHNLRLVLFVMNKYFQDLAGGAKFHDFCQAGVTGLITAIDRFQPGRKLRLSTYAMFWIRHFIIRDMTLSSFTKVSFGLESIRLKLKRAKEQLSSELQRSPTEDELIKKVGITRSRYNDVMKASRPIYSLNAKHPVTQEEYIDGITDHDDDVGNNRRQQPALLRLALDDVLDSLKPKESLVIRQRFGLDGKGKRSLGEIAGNLNLSREMVRKYEVTALMKLRHPARVDYLRGYIS